MKDERLAELQQLSQGLNAAWPTLLKWLNERKEKYLRELVEKDDEQTRGRLKELQAILELPQAAQDEAEVLLKSDLSTDSLLSD